MIAIDLCAGAGGGSLGFHRAGFHVHGVEIDADAVETHRRHVGPCDHSDITKWSPVFRCDVVGGGVPCQTFSPAGDRAGFDDPRGQLFMQVLRIAEEGGASVLWLENSFGITTWRDDKGRRASEVIAQVIRDAGWFPQHTVLNAADYGVPQRRRRWILVAFRDRETSRRFYWPEPTHGTTLTARADHVTVRQAFDLPVNDDVLDRPSPTITAGGTKSGGAEPIACQRQRKEFMSALKAALPESPIDKVAPTIVTNASHQGTSKRPSQRRLGELSKALEEAGLLDRPATTVAADPRLPKAGHHDRQPGAVKLTVERCAILQGFPSDWTWTGPKTSQHCQVGNAIPPPLAEAIALSIKNALVILP